MGRAKRRLLPGKGFPFARPRALILHVSRFSGATCTLLTTSRSVSKCLVFVLFFIFIVGATCTVIAASAAWSASTGLFSRLVVGTSRKAKACGGKQTGETQTTKEFPKLLKIHHPPPLKLVIKSGLSSQKRREVPSAPNSSYR